MKLRLKPISAVDNTLEIEWDESAGAVSGPDAKMVEAWAKQAESAGVIAVHPIPTYIDCDANPLTDRALFAALLSLRYQLPEALADAVPQPETDGDIDVDVIY